jgi:hypothetical protein
MPHFRHTLIAVGLTFACAAHAQSPGEPFAYAYTAAENDDELELHVWEGEDPAVGLSGDARVDYFTIEPISIRLRPGERYDLRGLRISAHSLHGEPFASAPLRLSLEAPAGLIELEAFAEDGRSLLAMRRGIGRLWIESVFPRGTGMGEIYRLPVVIIVE